MLLALCVLAGVLVAGMAFPGALALGMVSNEAGDNVNSVSTDLATGQLPQTSTITDAAGTPIAYLFDQNRDPVPAEQISPAMKAAIVAVEDRRFYQHQGVDWQGTARAVVANSASGDVVQGASTLTQQYVKNYLLYVEAETEAERLKATEQTPARKLREARIALQMERSLSKEDILARYLNIVFWGNDAYGISAAARTYFGTTADQLTVPQAALLAGMVRSTTQFDPVANPQAALDRRNLVITQMQEQGMIDQDQAEQALAEPLGIVTPLGTRKNGCIGAGDAGFFCKYVTDYLAEAGVPLEQILRGGYTIKTTLDRNAMEKMKASLNAEVPADQPNVANVMAIVAPGQDKHRVLAMGSSRTFGLDAGEAGDQLRAALRAGEPGRGLGLQDLHDGDGPAEGPGHQLPDDRPAVRLRLPDLRRRQRPPDPGGQLGELPGAAVDHGCAGAVAEHRVHQARGVHRRPGRRRHGGAAGDEVAGDHPVRRPEHRTAHGPVHRRGHQGPEAGLVHPRGEPDQRAGAVERRRDAGVGRQVVPAEPDRVGHRRERPAGDGHRGAVRPGRRAGPGEHAADGDEQGRHRRAAPRRAPPGRWAGTGRWRARPAPPSSTSRRRSSGSCPQMSGAVIAFDNSNSPKPLCDGAGAPFACREGNIFGGKTPAETWFGTMKPLLEGQPVQALPPTDPRYTEGGAESKVPNVVGRGQNDARAILERAGWKVSTRSVDNRAERGTVVGQNPNGTALPGETILLQISSGEVPPPPARRGPPGDDGGDNGGGDDGDDDDDDDN